jgi:2-alkyl-3-oxoalkanoate reductase
VDHSLTAQHRGQVFPAGGNAQRIGIIGAGGIAPNHIVGIRAIPGVVLTAISDPVEARARALAQLYAIPKVYKSHRAMLAAEPIDVVHVLTPPEHHVSVTIDALRADCDVFVEKPLGLSTAECLEVCSEAARLGRAVGVNHSDSHAPAFRRLLDVIASRRLGRINHMAVTYAIPATTIPVRDPGHYMFRSPGNIAFEFGPHPFSMIRLVMGGSKRMSTIVADEVSVTGGAAYYRSWLCSMECERGTAQLHISLGQGLKEITTHVIGQDGMAFADSRRGILNVYESSPNTLTEHLRSSLKNGTGAAVSTFGSIARQVGARLKIAPYFTPNGFQQSIQAFYSHRATRHPIYENADAGLEVVRYCEAMSTAPFTGGSVTWDQATLSS